MNCKYFIALLTMLTFPSFAFADKSDKPVKFEALPVAVATIIERTSTEAKLTRLVLGNEDGMPAYEATWNNKDHRYEIVIVSDGTLLTLDEVILLAEKPKDVRAAMIKEVADYKMLEIGKVIQKSMLSYEFAIEKDQGKEVICFSKEGKILSREKSVTTKIMSSFNKEKIVK